MASIKLIGALISLVTAWSIIEDARAQNLLGPDDVAKITRLDQSAVEKLIDTIVSEKYSRHFAALPRLPSGLTENAWWKECMNLKAVRLHDDFNTRIDICSNRRQCTGDLAAKLEQMNPYTTYQECVDQWRGGTGGIGAGQLPGHPELEVPKLCKEPDGSIKKLVAQTVPSSDKHGDCGTDDKCWKERTDKLNAQAATARNEGRTRDANDLQKAADAAAEVSKWLRAGDTQRAVQNVRVWQTHRQAVINRYLRNPNKPHAFKPPPGEEYVPECAHISAIMECVAENGADLIGCVKKLTDKLCSLTGCRCEETMGPNDVRGVRCRHEPPAIKVQDCRIHQVAPFGNMCDWCADSNPVASNRYSSGNPERAHCTVKGANVRDVSFIETTKLGEIILELCKEGAPLPMCRQRGQNME